VEYDLAGTLATPLFHQLLFYCWINAD